MARDPFAPVQQSSIPKWVWLIAGMFGVLILALGAVVLVVATKRPTAMAAVPANKPAVTPPGTQANPAKPENAVAANSTSKPDVKPDTKTDEDKGDKPEKKKHHKSSSSKSAKHDSGSSSSSPASPPPPPKKKSDMSQKDIDKLLGL